VGRERPGKGIVRAIRVGLGGGRDLEGEYSKSREYKQNKRSTEAGGKRQKGKKKYWAIYESGGVDLKFALRPPGVVDRDATLVKGRRERY